MGRLRRHMIQLLAALAITSIQYRFPVGQMISYSMAVKFDGFLPVLGGKDGTAAAGLDVSVTGVEPDKDGNPRVRSQIDGLKMSINGAVLPLNAKNIQTFFPPTTISISPEGRVLKTDAPEARLGVQLPGLDARRFPDISYLPIEFPADDLVVGQAFQFKKRFGETDMTYTVTPLRLDAREAEFAVVSSQDYEGFEDDRHNPIAASAGAAYRLSTHLAGKGVVKFDLTRHLVSSLHIEAEAKTHVTATNGGPIPDRDLKTVLDVKLAPA